MDIVMKIVGLILLFVVANGQKYLGGSNSDYTLDSPGGDICVCLSDEACLVVNSFEIDQNETDIDVNEEDDYILGSANERADPKLVLELIGSFSFIVSKNYTIKYLEVFFFFFLSCEFFIFR
jgi:hypothetical protein